jgi:hypothetical protein
LQGDPIVLQISTRSDASLDSLWVRADLLVASESASVRSIVADREVKLGRGNFSSVADSLLYQELIEPPDSALVTETLTLMRNPIAWYESTQISGDTLRLDLSSGTLDTLRVFGSAFVAKWDSTLQRANQLRGATMRAGFQRDTLRTMLFQDRAEMVYFSEKDQLLDKMVKTASNWIRLAFENDEISAFTAARGVDGTVYDSGTLPPNPDLSGYTWAIERRPTKADFSLTDFQRQQLDRYLVATKEIQ